MGSVHVSSGKTEHENSGDIRMSQSPSSDVLINEQTGATMARMAQMGMNPAVLSVLMEMGGVSKDEIRYATGPIVIHENGWGDTLPEWIGPQVKAERMEIVLRDAQAGMKSEDVGPTELMAVLYPATMASPLDHETTQLYLWASSKAISRHKSISADEIAEMVGSEVIADEEVYSLEGNLNRRYRMICSEIRRKVIEESKRREKQGV